jgi:hypothetical protein
VTAALAAALALATGNDLAVSSRSDFDEAESALAALTALEPDEDLQATAAQKDPGPTPLLGTPHTAETYSALLWNGERFERHGVSWGARLLFLARASGGRPDRLAAGVQAGEAMRATWPPEPTTTPVAGLTVDTVSSGVCAAVSDGLEGEAVEQVAELAAALMLITPAAPGSELAGLHAGHALASGWLAVQLHRSGLVAAPGTSAEVLATRETP